MFGICYGEFMLKIASGRWLGIWVVGFVLFSSSWLWAGSVTVSWNHNTEADLAGYRVYYGTQSQNYQTTLDVGLDTFKVVDNLQEGVRYYFAVTAYDTANNESDFSEEVSIVLKAKQPPKVVHFAALNPQELSLRFDQAMDVQSLKEASHYQISPSVAIRTITTSLDSTEVQLHTAPHRTEIRYTLKVSGVKNSEGIAQASSYSTTYEFSDIQPPTVDSVKAISITKLAIYFSEPVDAYTATQTSHYSISPTVSILQAQLDSTKRIVILMTAPHAYETAYTLTIRDVEDVHHNAMEKAFRFSYSFRDTRPPFLTNFLLVDRKTIQMDFDEPLKASVVQQSGNYTIKPTVAIESIELKNSGKSVLLHTAEHSASTTYRLTIRNLEDVQGNKMSAPYQIVYTFSDYSAPGVSRVHVLDVYTLTVEFTEKMNYQSIADKSHYSIAPHLDILAVDVDTSLQKVTLHSAKHSYGQKYTLTVHDVKDLNQNVMATPFTYEYSFSDAYPPYVLKVNLLDRQRVELIFSEPMDPNSIGDVANYAIQPNIHVYRVDVDSTQTKAVLYTNNHSYGVVYVLSFSHLVDQAGNRMPPNYEISYQYAPPVHVTNLNRSNYKVAVLHSGDKFYVDRDYQLQTIPQELASALWVETANNDKFSTGDDFLHFTIDRKAELYVGYDERLRQLPNWLTKWEKTDLKIRSKRGDSYRVYHTSADSGQVVLGGNNGTDNSNMYLVLLKGSDEGIVAYPDPPQKHDSQNTNTKLPETIVLNQNYPNPFNPSTVISFSLSQEDAVQMDIYNLSGQRVRHYDFGVVHPGTVRIVWDATNDLGQPVASGIYIYQLRSLHSVQTRKMALIR